MYINHICIYVSSFNNKLKGKHNLLNKIWFCYFCYMILTRMLQFRSTCITFNEIWSNFIHHIPNEKSKLLLCFFFNVLSPFRLHWPQTFGEHASKDLPLLTLLLDMIYWQLMKIFSRTNLNQTWLKVGIWYVL